MDVVLILSVLSVILVITIIFLASKLWSCYVDGDERDFLDRQIKARDTLIDHYRSMNNQIMNMMEQQVATEYLIQREKMERWEKSNACQHEKNL